MISLSSWYTESTAANTAQLAELLGAVYAADGRPMVKAGSVPADFLGGEQLSARDGELLAGFLRLETRGDAFGRPVAELFVHPEHRGKGIGAALITELLRKVGIAEGSAAADRVRVWAHGDDPAAARLGERFGFSRVREMHRMHMDLGKDIAEPVFPNGVRLRTFVPGTDEQAVIEVNRRAFDWHPEQGALSVADLMREENEDWFDAEGLFLAETDSSVVLGFHWTKVHERAVGDSSGRPMGEVYVVGVDPAAQGGGLGKALTAAGLRYLRDRGLSQVMLYVESDNPAAIRVYERLGFAIWDTDVQYAK